ncbi:hypothetical protein [Kaarinaea lacus]
MINYLLYYQFPFLYLPAIVIGLVVFGSDFDSVAGWLYVVPLLVFPFLHRYLCAKRLQIYSGNTFLAFSLAGGVSGLLVYGSLHVGVWDEHSLTQALLIAVLGVSSYVVSVVATVAIKNHSKISTDKHVAALVFVSLCWLAAEGFPMIAFFAIAVLLLLGAVWRSPLVPSYAAVRQAVKVRDLFASYTVFLLLLSVGMVVWDYQVNTQWAPLLAIVFFTSAFGFVTAGLKSELLERGFYAAVLVNFLLAWVWPVYMLTFTHVAVIGVALGYFLARLQRSQQGDTQVLTFGWMVWLFFALVLGNAFYANLEFVGWRIVLVFPYLLIMMFVLIKISVEAKKQRV